MSKEYDAYLSQHNMNIFHGFHWFKNNIPEVFDPLKELWYDAAALDRKKVLDLFAKQLATHDQSKYSTKQYKPYDDYFYGEKEKTIELCESFNGAWLDHIHKEPHHWQHWVLINDDIDYGLKALDMPYNYILEMILDWWSFSWNTSNLSEIFDWYEKRKYYICFSQETRKTVEHILDLMKTKLDEKE